MDYNINFVFAVPNMKVKHYILVFFLLELGVSSEFPREWITVQTPNGRIQGKIELSYHSNRTYYAFYSVRYAEPPVGSLRFQAPVPVKPWSTTYNATYEKYYCFQVIDDTEHEDEDCLFANIFSPKSPLTNPNLPVMVYLHGGGFIQGSGQVRSGFGPEFFMDYDVVLVTVNYRLGPFGFFSTGDGVIPGNAGLKDVHLALKWINSNIQLFGGDPVKVTLFGYSAGSAAVSYQLLNPSSKGLFRAVILRGGSAINPWAFQRNQVEITYKTAAYLNMTFSEKRNSIDLLKFLQNASAKDIDTASKSYTETHQKSDNLQLQQGFFYAPTLESHNNTPFLTKHPYDSFQKGDFIQVPAIVGTNAEEALYMYYLKDYFNSSLKDMDNDVKLLVPGGLHIVNERDRTTVGKLIKTEYTKSSFCEDILAGIKFHSDQDFTKSLIKTAHLHASKAPVYFFEFTYQGVLGDFQFEFPGSGNVSHGEDNNYIFNRIMHLSKLNNADLSQFSQDDVMVHNRLIKLLINFAIYVDPTPEDDGLLQNVRWPQIKPHDFSYLVVGRDLVIKKDLKKVKMQFWDRIYEQYGVGSFETF